MNNFLNSVASYDARTQNGAISHSTSGNSILDYFAKCGSYRGRSEMDVNADMASIFAEDSVLAMKCVLYNRMVTRKTNGFDSVQKGQGQRDEFVKSIKWLETNRPKMLYSNVGLIPMIGRWSDLWYDSAATGYHHYVSTDVVYPLVKEAIQNKDSLLAKYLPKIHSRKKSNERQMRLSEWARGLCRYLGWTEKQYRQFKSGGEATKFQTAICTKSFHELDFNTIPGAALTKMLSRGKDGKNIFERHGLEKRYLEWIEKQPVAKFTGYPYQLFQAACPDSIWYRPSRTLLQTVTLNKQFDGLLKMAEDDVMDGGVWCALDTSGSMSHQVGQNVRAIDVCIGLGLYFSSLMKGAFKDHVVFFDNQSRVKKLSGTFCEKVDQVMKESTAWGSTNFQSVIDEIVRVRQTNPNVPVEDFPKTLLTVSDMQFNCSGDHQTNYEVAMEKLERVGLPKIRIIWWNVNGQYGNDVPNKMDDEGVVMISGFDGAIVSSLLGEEVKENGETRQKTPLEAMMDCLNQDILNLVQ